MTHQSMWTTQDAMDAVVETLQSAGHPMTGEELVNALVARGIDPPDQRAFGIVFAKLSRTGVIQCVGFATRAKGHGTAGARVWGLV